MKKTKKIYLDGAANSPLDPAVFKAMRPYLEGKYCGNSHGIHEDGRRSLLAVEESRQKIAKQLCVHPEEVFFTSGATEANNWIFMSMLKYMLRENPDRNEIIVSSVEHASILSAAREVEKMGMIIKYVNPTESGRILLRDVTPLLTHKTLAVCVMAVNNELGSVSNVERLGQLAHSKGAYMISDFTQAFTYGDGTLSLCHYPHVDYFTFSGHKIYGPTGIGCLIARKYKPLYPLLAGGSQERGLRGGTHNVASIVGLATAIDLMRKRNDAPHYKELYTLLVEGIAEINKLYKVNVSMNAKPHHLNIVNLNFSSVYKFDDLASLLSIYGVECSAGAACGVDIAKDGKPIPSHVLMAIHVPEDEIGSCVRISFTKYTNKKEITYLLKTIETIVKQYKTEDH